MRGARPSVIVVGASLGGLSALGALLSGLPRQFPLPVVMVQHRGEVADASLISLLAVASALVVSEPDDKEPLTPGQVYLAPGGYHLLLEPGQLALSTEAPVNHSRPSIDVLFESAADSYGSGAVGVVLTGLGTDGARGAARIRGRGGIVVVQDPASAEAGAMPAAAIAACPLAKVLPLAEIPSFLAGLSRGRGES